MRSIKKRAAQRILYTLRTDAIHARASQRRRITAIHSALQTEGRRRCLSSNLGKSAMLMKFKFKLNFILQVFCTRGCFRLLLWDEQKKSKRGYTKKKLAGLVFSCCACLSYLPAWYVHLRPGHSFNTCLSLLIRSRQQSVVYFVLTIQNLFLLFFFCSFLHLLFRGKGLEWQEPLHVQAGRIKINRCSNKNTDETRICLTSSTGSGAMSHSLHS